MRVALKLEEIGYNTYKMMRSFGCYYPRRSWVKRGYLKITSISAHSEWEYITANETDYSEANSVGSRGVYKYYWLEDGEVYWICEPKSWGSNDIYYCAVINGQIKRLTKEEAETCLSLPLV